MYMACTWPRVVHVYGMYRDMYTRTYMSMCMHVRHMYMLMCMLHSALTHGSHHHTTSTPHSHGPYSHQHIHQHIHHKYTCNSFVRMTIPMLQSVLTHGWHHTTFTPHSHHMPLVHSQVHTTTLRARSSQVHIIHHTPHAAACAACRERMQRQHAPQRERSRAAGPTCQQRSANLEGMYSQQTRAERAVRREVQNRPCKARVRNPV